MMRKYYFKGKNKSFSLAFTILVVILISTILLPINIKVYNKSEKFDNTNEDSSFIIQTSSTNPPNKNYFKYYKAITITHEMVYGFGSYQDFPVLISILDSDLHDHIEQSNGNDIAFANDIDWLDHEIEIFNQNYNNTHAKLIAWVRIPSLSTSVNTNIFLYYGNSTMNSRQNSTGVWSNNYKGVWHLSESTGSVLDSTSYNTSGTVTGTVTRKSKGKADGAYNFGNNGQINFGDPSDGHLDFGTGSFTISFWLNITFNTSWYQLPLYKGATTTNDVGYDFETNADVSALSFRICDDSENLAQSPSIEIFDDIGDWIYITGVVDRASNRIRIFKNGFQEGSGSDIASIGNINNNKDLLAPNSDYDLYGLLDEIRICNVQRSAGWIATEYSNQNNPFSFYSIGEEFSISDHPPNAHYFKYFKEIIIDHNLVFGTENHKNFPVLINILDSDLHDDVQSTGNDIAFANETAWLDHEIVVFNQTYSTSYAELIVWVQIPNLYALKDTIIMMFYGNSTMGSQENPEGVWDSGYEGVYHLDDDFLDATAHNRDGTNTGSDDVKGMIADGQDFEHDDGGDYINIGNWSVSGSMITIQAWVKYESFDSELTGYSDGRVLSKNSGTSDTRQYHVWMLGTYNDSVDENGPYYLRGNLKTGADDAIGTTQLEATSGNLVIDQWYLTTLKYDGSNFYLALDGDTVITQSKTGLLRENSWPIFIGNSPTGNRPIDAVIDEVKISSTIRSNDWLKTEYANQYDPDSFYTVGKEYTVSGNPPNEHYFKHYKELLIDHTMVNGSHDLINFPLLISILDSDLHDDVQSTGNDIAFALKGAWLDHEIELFTQDFNDSHAQLIAWVSLPRLSTSENTIIHMYYGNSTMEARENANGVWNSNFLGVWHLGESGSGARKDSTSNGNDGTPSNYEGDEKTTGLIGFADVFDEINDIIIVNDFNYGPEFSVSFWFNESDLTGNYYQYMFSHASHNVNQSLNIFFAEQSAGSNPNGITVAFRDVDDPSIPGAGKNLPTGFADGNWHLFCLTTESGFGSRYYIDGELILSDSRGGDYYDPNSNIAFGGRIDLNSVRFFGGLLDEIHISNIQHSADWIATEYNNQYNPQSFMTVGSEETFDNTAPTYSNLEESSNPLELGETEVITINISDPSGIKRSLIEFEGVNNSMENIVGDTWQYNWTAPNVGNYSYTIWMEDNFNNWNSTTGSIEVIDTTPPTYSDLIESANPLQLGQNETISIKVYDSPGSGVNQVLLEYESLNHTMILMSGKWSWSKWKPNSTGNYPYKIYMEDKEHNWNETSGSIEVISTYAPVIENVTTSEENLELGDNITIFVDVFDIESNVSTVFIELESVNYTMNAPLVGNTYNYTWTRSYVGIVYYTIYANDTDNNWNSYSSSFDIIDTTPPVIENLTVSEETLELGDTVVITVNSTDLSAINQVWIEFEGSNHSMTNISGNTWQYTSWSPSSTGNYSYTIWAEDNNDNWDFISSSILVQDTTPPIYSDLIESADPVELGDQLIISINATDLADIKEVSIEYENSNHTMTNTGSDIWQYTSWRPNSIGNYTYKIYVIDNNNNLNYIESSILFQDTVLPIYSNLFESTDPLELGDNPIIRIDVYDFADINQCLIEIEGMNSSMSNIYGDTWQFDIWTPNSWGVYQYRINMEDKSGNWNFVIANITVQDTTPPPIPILANSPSGDVSGSLVFDWSDGSDPSGILYYILIIDNETVPSATPGYIYYINITNTGSESSYHKLPITLPLGEYYFFLAQIDGVGLQSSYTMGTFTVISTKDDSPIILIMIAIILAIMIGSATTIVIVRKNLKKDITPPREKISFKIISSHINKLLQSKIASQAEEIQSLNSGGKQISTTKELKVEEELKHQINEFKIIGEELFAEGAYLEAQKQFLLARDLLLKVGRDDEAKVLSELISGITELIEEREKRINTLEQVKFEGDPVKIYENFYNIIEISKRLRDSDTSSFYQSELINYFQNNMSKLINIENFRANLEQKADSLMNNNIFEDAVQLYEKCENISQLFVSLEKDEEIANIEKFRKKKKECSKKLS